MRVLPLRRTWRPVLYGSRFFLYFATATLDVGAAAAQQHLFRYLVITQSGRFLSRSPSSQQGLHVFSTATRASARVVRRSSLLSCCSRVTAAAQQLAPADERPKEEIGTGGGADIPTGSNRPCPRGKNRTLALYSIAMFLPLT